MNNINLVDSLCQDTATTESAGSRNLCCVLCGNKDNQMISYSNWGTAERQFLSKHLSESPQNDTTITLNIYQNGKT